jgi:hypothetical protein
MTSPWAKVGEVAVKTIDADNDADNREALKFIAVFLHARVSNDSP